MGFKNLCSVALAYFSHLLSGHIPSVLLVMLSPFRSVNKASSFLFQAPNTCRVFCLECASFPLLLAAFHQPSSFIKTSPQASLPSLTTIFLILCNSSPVFPSHTYDSLKLFIYCLFTCWLPISPFHGTLNSRKAETASILFSQCIT